MKCRDSFIPLLCPSPEGQEQISPPCAHNGIRDADVLKAVNTNFLKGDRASFLAY